MFHIFAALIVVEKHAALGERRVVDFEQFKPVLENLWRRGFFGSSCSTSRRLVMIWEDTMGQPLSSREAMRNKLLAFG